MTWMLDSGRPLLSHPREGGHDEKKLWDHLSGVSNRAADVTGGDLAEVERLLGLAHDFPKATPAFQGHVRSESFDDPKHHARLASLVAYYFLKENGYDRDIRLAGLIAVAKHHGSVPDVAGYIRRNFKEHRSDENKSDTTVQALQQVQKINSHAAPFANHVFEKAVDNNAWNRFLDRIGEPGNSPLLEEVAEDAGERRGIGSILSIDPEHFSSKFYTTFLSLFGGLTLADKTDAAGVADDDERLQGERPDLSELNAYLETLGGDEQNGIEANLNEVRSGIQAKIPKQTTAFLNSKKDVATLTLPTGYGKTLAGLLAGLEIADKEKGRVVYALPFTSIIDQTAETLRDIFGVDVTGNLLTIHHHLAETRTVEESDEEVETDEHASHEVMLAESWRTGLTLTTFVQLFESLAGPTNGQSLKLPALRGSTVIIDEPQAIPQYWWPLARRLIEFLTEDLEASVILMTATQPSLIEESRSFELMPREILTALEKEQFDGSFPSRVNYHFHNTAFATTNEDCLEYEQAASKLAVTAKNGNSVLSICNTIGSARKLTDAFTEVLSQSDEDLISIATQYRAYLDDQDIIGGIEPTAENGRVSRERAQLVRDITEETRSERIIPYLHLSARVRPCDRQFLLAVASDLSGIDVPFVLISTQLVEAGVDISFDTVFRDFAPLDAIVQAAGRCNRSYERAPETGKTTVWQLKPAGDGNKPPSTAVYAPNRTRGETDLLRQTQETLEVVQAEHGKKVPDDVLATDAVERYHELVGERVHSVADSNELVTAFEQANGERLRMASLIERRQSVEIYVCRSRSERNQVKKVGEAARRNQYERVESLRDKLAPIRVSIPVPRAQTDAASGLISLKKLVGDRGDPERILETPDPLFDTEFGVQLSAYSVEDRFF